MFEIQQDDTAQRLAAFTDESTRDHNLYVQKFRKILANDAITSRVIVVGAEIVGSVASFPMEDDIEVSYWIRRDWWGRGVATAALAALLEEVKVRPLHARAVEDNLGSVRVLERNGFVQVGSEESFAEGRQATVTELIFRLDN